MPGSAPWLISTINEDSVKSSVINASALLVAAILVVAAAAQTSPPAQSPAVQQSSVAVQNAAASPVAEVRVYPAPTNLEVLPKNLTGQQVHAIMEQWSGELGVHCNSCHMEDRINNGPKGRPKLDFSDDSKGMKLAARLMFTMTEQINGDFIAKVEGSGVPVTCGTCHRGQVTPEPFSVLPPAGTTVAVIQPRGKERTLAQ
jgi:hypothetical protein